MLCIRELPVTHGVLFSVKLVGTKGLGLRQYVQNNCLGEFGKLDDIPTSLIVLILSILF